VATEREMLDRLNVRYGKTFKNGSYVGRRYTRAEQVPTQPGRWGGHRSADYIAVDQHGTSYHDLLPEEQKGLSYTGRQSIHVFEVKVTRSDLKHELDHPEKSEEWSQYAHYFWLVVPDKKLIVGFDIPETWGILASYGKSLTVVKQPTRKLPIPMPVAVVAALTRAAVKTEVRLALDTKVSSR
jgi:hypothetical protein